MSSASEQGRAVIPARKKKHTAQTEKEKYIIDPRDMKIAWGPDETQWRMANPKEEESYAEAIKVIWFEVKATHKGAKPGSKYQIGFNITLKPDAFGWDSSPVFLMAKVGESGSYTWKRLYLDSKEVEKPFDIVIPITAEDTTLHFGLYEIWGGRWKGGLCIHNAYVNEV